MRRQSGFSLIELLIVVAIILIVSAIAVPNLLRARIAANEASAVSSMRTINHAQITYSSTYPTAGYANVLAKLGPPDDGCTAPTEDAACLVDHVLADGRKSGYEFLLATADSESVISTYTLRANPLTPGATGQRRFFVNQTGVVRFNVIAQAEQTDPPIQ